MSNLPAKKYQHTTPTQTRLVFEFDAGQNGGFIDIAKCLSQVNRRFYRQGLYYYVNSFEVQNLETGYVDIKIAPDTWQTQMAWRRAFKHFQKMNALVDTPRPKYHDFKVFLDSTHRNDAHNNQPSAYINPIGVGSQGVTADILADEWAYSQFVSGQDRDPLDTDNLPAQFNMHIVGDHDGAGPDDYNSIGMIYSYMNSRVMPPSTGEPTIPSTNDNDPLLRLMDFGQSDTLEEIADHLDMFNDQTPYNRDKYMGSADNHLVPLQRLQTSTSSTGRTHEVSGACVPMGLLRFDSVGYNSSWRLILNIASGTYNGVYAERV